MKRQQGFTLIEIAIVLVIIGLLLGGVLKGQELITSARVRNLISTQDGVKAAYFGFLDRFRALPGDYSQASTNISCGASPCSNGNNNGQIETTATPASGSVVNENILVWEHLSKAGFINGSYTYAVAPENTDSAPANPYSRYMQLSYDSTYEGTATTRHNLKTGNQIPSDILVEVDRKVDDGKATTGTFRASAYGGQTGVAAITIASCYSGADWLATTPVTNCGAASLF
jgi:prepilin-type N-terminal cleavage/methylation domain-containing protein